MFQFLEGGKEVDFVLFFFFTISYDKITLGGGVSPNIINVINFPTF